MDSPVTLSASMGISFFLAIGVTYAVQGVKWICEILPTTKTNNLPSWLWVAISMLISCAVCWTLKVDAIATLFESADIGLSSPWTYLASGLAIGVSSNVVYEATKPLRKKVKKGGKVVCLPPGADLPDEEISQIGDNDSQSGNTATQSGNGEQNQQQLPTTVVTPVPPEPLISEPVIQPSWPTAILLQDVTPTNGKHYYVALNAPHGALHQVQTNKGT